MFSTQKCCDLVFGLIFLSFYDFFFASKVVQLFQLFSLKPHRLLCLIINLFSHVRTALNYFQDTRKILFFCRMRFVSITFGVLPGGADFDHVGNQFFKFYYLELTAKCYQVSFITHNKQQSKLLPQLTNMKFWPSFRRYFIIIFNCTY